MGKKKKRLNANTVACRCCEKRCDATNLTRLGTWLANHKIYGDDALVYARNSYVAWACDTCIDSGKALAATAIHQNMGNSYGLPYFAYIDQQKQCETCKTSFLFSKEEQLYWYEDLNFPVYADAINCKNCRKTIRDENAETTKLSQLISNLDASDVKELEAIITIFIKWDNTDKARFYLSFIPKIAGFKTNNALIAKHAALKEQIQKSSPK
jgi:hypothetical protein